MASHPELLADLTWLLLHPPPEMVQVAFEAISTAVLQRMPAIDLLEIIADLQTDTSHQALAKNTLSTIIQQTLPK